jgi:monoamine oxidase
MEMGATWFSKPSTSIALLDELNIEYFKQHTQGISFFETMSLCLRKNLKFQMPKNPSYRIVGGTATLMKN